MSNICTKPIIVIILLAITIIVFSCGNRTDVFIERGDILLNSGEYDKAIMMYNNALEVNPFDKAALTSRGFAKYMEGDYDGSIEDNSKAIEIDPLLPDAHSTLGLTYLAKGNIEKALIYEL